MKSTLSNLVDRRDDSVGTRDREPKPGGARPWTRIDPRAPGSAPTTHAGPRSGTLRRRTIALAIGTVAATACLGGLGAGRSIAQGPELSQTSSVADAGSADRATTPRIDPHLLGVFRGLSGLTCRAVTFTHEGIGSDPIPDPDSSEGCDAGSYVEGEIVHLIATPAEGWVIVGWTGTDADSSTGLQNSFTMPATEHAVSVTYDEALFEDDFEAGYFSAWDLVSLPIAEDDYESFDPTNWQTFSEGWEAVDGLYRSTNTAMQTPVSTLWAGSDLWADYTVEADVRVDAVIAGASAGLVFRFAEEWPSADRCTCMLGTNLDGETELSLFCGDTDVLQKEPFDWQAGTWYRLRASAVGDRVTCEVEGESFFLESESVDVNAVGPVGLRSTHVESDYDNFVVVYETP